MIKSSNSISYVCSFVIPNTRHYHLGVSVTIKGKQLLDMKHNYNTLLEEIPYIPSLRIKANSLFGKDFHFQLLSFYFFYSTTTNLIW